MEYRLHVFIYLQKGLFWIDEEISRRNAAADIDNSGRIPLPSDVRVRNHQLSALERNINHLESDLAARSDLQGPINQIFSQKELHTSYDMSVPAVMRKFSFKSARRIIFSTVQSLFLISNKTSKISPTQPTEGE